MAKWTGTLILVFQPNEERAGGAQAMVDALAFMITSPFPDIVLGKVGLRKGPAMAAADSFKVIDPVTLAANVAVRLQGIVRECAVVTVGSLQAGQTENLMSLPTRQSFVSTSGRQTTFTREKLLKAIRRIIEKECEASGCEKKPLVEETTRFPLTLNDNEATANLSRTFGETFGQDFIPDVVTSNASEDVSILATSVQKPCCFWFFGGTDGEK